jgi:two-component system response regulator FixJ
MLSDITNRVAVATPGILAHNTVILVDDDEAVRDSLRVLLELRGHVVEDFGSAEDCIARGHPDEAGCLVVDFHMPVTNGLGLIRSLRDNGIPIPAILISGAMTPMIRREAEALNLSGVFEKPCDNNLLLDAIDRVLAEPTVS